MLNFKMEKHYKDTEGNLWKFCGYVKNSENNIYYFQSDKNYLDIFYEQPDNSVTEWPEGKGIKIPFVEEKERDWVIGEQYECYCIKTQKIIKVKLVETDNPVITEQNYRFKSNKEYHWLYGKGEVLSREYWVVFKNGIPEELKDRINKGKLTNKRKCFHKGQIYKDIYGAEYMFIKRIKAPDGLYAIFYEKKDDEVVALELYKINNVECCLLLYRVDLCPDESIRNEDVLKAVRVMQ